MLIRYGYEITLACTQPTAMVSLLEVHEDRKADLRAPENLHFMPDIPSTTYHDIYGNRCRRFVAPAGELKLWGDATIEESEAPDPVVRSGLAQPPQAARGKRAQQPALTGGGRVQGGSGLLQPEPDPVVRPLRLRRRVEAGGLAVVANQQEQRGTVAGGMPARATVAGPRRRLPGQGAAA